MESHEDIGGGGASFVQLCVLNTNHMEINSFMSVNLLVSKCHLKQIYCLNLIMDSQNISRKVVGYLPIIIAT